MPEEERVTCLGKEYTLYPPIFWHVAAPNGVPIYNNAHNHEGLMHSISFINQFSGMEDALSFQSLKGRTDEKEILWEQIRKEIDSNLPTRNGAIFLVDSREQAVKITEKWFPNQARNILKVRVVRPSSIFQADATWLDVDRDDWEMAARQYWTGRMTDLPMPETLVHGTVYFADWRSPPFGFFAGLAMQ